ncbi:3-hydroxyacyl-CoA dehydrogenase [Lichenifustis flavocetrariae]|uniref:3-hydroxyacyl-CoA dehydrogenase n=1 Tax=Lichenifustis flavocetrariae TaxID=2949735 RepID=A0AA42CGU4_9HYPH|nr:3-hydroxyacyl-CoA dehydrogenase [Lichenifustis flavocetrariae]MCW6506918.1 3-hydroxyacyl-CoA dehydrogenase [Lichenifustis flavocetrariae]
MKTAIIGAGFVGRAWAISFARAGHDVRIWDANPAAPHAARDFIAGILPDLEANDLLNGGTPDALLARLNPVADLAEALADVDYVQENTPERVEVKRQVFADLDQHAPETAVLASSTSALLPSSFVEHVPGRSRCLVCHPINPPYLIPAVEVCPSPWTKAETVDKAAAFLRSCGQAPLVMKREIDGFIMNRLQGALLEEAFRLVADGIAGVEDIDIGLRDGLALRWSFMGPFETIDLNAPGGVRDYAERYQGIYSGIFPSVQRRVDWTGPVMETVEATRRAKLGADQLGDRQMWRDRRLMALLAHKRRAANDIGE